MALKDWKKIRNDNTFIVYNKKGKPWQTYQLVIGKYHPKRLFSKYSNKWYVDTPKTTNLTASGIYIQMGGKTFNTKSQALKYAKTYMRKH